jgi:hypothetical protein
MEKINVAELLRDCPKGMELDCTMYENLYFDSLNADYYGTINCYTLIDGIKTSINLTKYGTFNNHPGAKCVIYPKGKTTWEGFVPPCKFKDGDVLFVETIVNRWIFIYKENENEENICKYVAIPDQHPHHIYIVYENIPLCSKETVSKIRFATEKEKEKLFQAIKDNGYRWNPETKALEELIDPIFKVGDKIRLKENHNYIYTITGIREKENKYECGVTFVLRFSEQDNWELVPDKFDINTLIPFESRVLARDNVKEKWYPGIWGYYDKDSTYPYKLIGVISRYCIPYEGNEHLLGTTKDCDKFYRTWEGE